MKFVRWPSSLTGSLALVLLLGMYAPATHANVYASNIKLNGALSGVSSVGQGTNTTISYILNDAASAGVTINVLFTVGVLGPTTTVRTISLAAGSQGTLKGRNTVVWDGKNDAGNFVAAGTYTISITSASLGYSVWTQFISTNSGNTNLWPSGIVADTNPNSPYYGRIMVANGGTTSAGVIKCNADGSGADEGQSNAGYSFPTNSFLGVSVRSLKYLADDRIAFDQWATFNGQIVACDMTMSTNQILWDSDNLPGAPWVPNLNFGFGDIDVLFPGTPNGMAFVEDFDFPSQGIWMWPLTNNGVYNPNFPGIQILQAGGGCAVAIRASQGLMLDNQGDIFVGQTRANVGDPVPRLFSFTNWPAAALPICNQNLAWAVGAADDTFRYVEALAVDSRVNPNSVSVAMRGASGGLRVLSATNGALVTNINQNTGIFYVGTGWDAVGNVYVGNTTHSWQAFSPPGANHATTVAVAKVQVLGPPVIGIVATNASAAEALDPDGTTNTGAFQITRTGDTRSNLTVWLNVGGSAIYAMDYFTMPPFVYPGVRPTTVEVALPVGSNAVTILVVPMDDNLVELDQTVVLTVVTNSFSHYIVSQQSSATVTIREDNDTPPPEVAITSPTNGSVFAFPANITIVASASSHDNQIVGVDFFAGTNFIGHAAGPSYQVNWTNVAIGNYSLIAVATDNLGVSSTSAPVAIAVVFVNQPPSFSKGPDIMVVGDSGAHSFPHWATNILPGPPWQSWETVNFIVTNSNNSLFTVQPAITPDGTLSFTLARDDPGTALVTVVLHNNGGTANGGQDTSPPQTFVITVTPANDAPVVVLRVFPLFTVSPGDSNLTVIASNYLDALVVFDASLSTNSAGDPMTFAWFKGGVTNPFATSAVAQALLAVGDNSIGLAISSGDDVTSTNFIVKVVTTGQAVAELLLRLDQLNLDPQLLRLLEGPLKSAQIAFDALRPWEGVVHLQVFQTRVTDHLSAIAPALAAELINLAHEIINLSAGKPGAAAPVVVLKRDASARSHLVFRGSAGAIHLVQVSTNLMDWATVGVATEVSPGSFEFFDSPITGATVRFYRLRLP